MMIESPVSDEELQLYFDYLVKNHRIVTEYFSGLDVDENQQYSAEELALEVV
jgi:hypothetical protein